MPRVLMTWIPTGINYGNASNHLTIVRFSSVALVAKAALFNQDEIMNF